MIGPLKIDKASVDMERFLQSVMIVKNAGGKTSRFNFKREMEILMNGHTSMPGVEPVGYIESTNERTPYNKSKLPRYFGFIKLTKSTSSRYSDLTLTKRGKMLSLLIDQGDDYCRILPGKKNDFMKLIIESILYDSFGKCNDGVEESNSDIEPPKALIKSIYLLGEITPEEFIYITWGLNRGWFDSFDAAIIEVRRLKSTLESSEFIKNKVEELGMHNFVRDNKLIDFFVKMSLLIVENVDGQKVVKFNSALFEEYKNEIQQMNPINRPLQLVLSGVPGTGKSFYVENSILGGVYDVNNVIRTIIHPDYSYSDFVGYVKPSSLGDSINYAFYPGPITKAITKAIANEKVNVYLIIEEMNRGNISTVMGDTFQLLDRIDDFRSPLHGWSQYAIENKDIYNYVKNNCGINLQGKFPINKVLIPSNLHIIGTMNTADQNVFVIDTAFRRRFRNIYLQIDFSEAQTENTYLQNLDIFSNNNIFGGVEGKNWSQFAKMINRKIDEINREFTSIPEDKKLAPYFVDLSDLKDKKSFSDKVLFYLKNDVFKYVENVLSESYQKIYEKIVINDGDPFTLFNGRES